VDPGSPLRSGSVTDGQLRCRGVRISPDDRFDWRTGAGRGGGPLSSRADTGGTDPWPARWLRSDLGHSLEQRERGGVRTGSVVGHRSLPGAAGTRFNCDQKSVDYDAQIHGGLQTTDPALIALAALDSRVADRPGRCRRQQCVRTGDCGVSVHGSRRARAPLATGSWMATRSSTREPECAGPTAGRSRSGRVTC
jgi:hypothetical protein